MDEKKYVGDIALNYYDPKFKTWFENTIKEVPVLDAVYHEENRVLEFVKRENSE